VTRKHVLIAGGAGFIGSHLSRRYARQVERVTVVDNLCTAPRWNLDYLAESPNITFIEHDICRPLPAGIGPVDAVLNLASPASPEDFKRLSRQILAVASLGVFNLLELAERSRCVFLQASTSECYGDPLVSPQPETYWGNVNPIGVRSCYDEGKRFAEAAVSEHHRRTGLPVRIARIFNTYGPNMRLDDGRVLPNFICQALAGKPLTVYGQGTQTRSFCYVDDLVEGLTRLVETDYHQPVNLGNPEEITVLQFAREVLEATGSRSPIEHRELPPDDPKIRRPDITLAKRLLNWAPATSRMEGIRKTVAYFRSKLDAANAR